MNEDYMIKLIDGAINYLEQARGYALTSIYLRKQKKATTKQSLNWDGHVIKFEEILKSYNNK